MPLIFFQLIVQANNKENKSYESLTQPFVSGIQTFPSQRASIAESVPKTWCHHGTYQSKLSHYNDVIMGVSDHQPHDCLLNSLFRRRSKKTSKLHVTGLFVGNSPGTGEFSAQMASNMEKGFHLMMSSCHNILTHGVVSCSHLFSGNCLEVFSSHWFPIIRGSDTITGQACQQELVGNSLKGWWSCIHKALLYLIARFMGPTWGPSGADRTQVGPMLASMNFAIWDVSTGSADWPANVYLG